jgi:hypothetical protein
MASECFPGVFGPEKNYSGCFFDFFSTKSSFFSTSVRVPPWRASADPYFWGRVVNSAEKASTGTEGTGTGLGTG